ncbi:uncharacterized protein LOC135206522 [Macrobrachium nipponense]|uniref:uncharacterized protein LOC135206522 n=1 Tax=Macrobrachium nipponense TaxID=159736 RepID=UPI0030C7B4B2
MEVDSPMLLPSLASLPSTSSVTITKASASQLRSSHSPSSSPPPPPPPPPPSSSSAVSTHSSVVFTSVSTSSSSTSHDVMSNINNGLLGPDMMPTIPLVPVQVPTGRGGVVTIPKARGRPKGMPFYTPRGGFQIRKGMKFKRIGMRGRGGRRLVHSMSLEERGAIGGDDSPLPLDEEAYAQDDMIITPSYQEKWPGRFCALCNLGEQSQLGQGDLIRHEPTPGFVLPEKFEVAETEIEECPSKKFKLNHPTHPTFLKDKGKSPRKQIGDLILPEPVDEISLVGHQEQPSVGYLFESGGHCLVHYMCALWSANVELTSDDIINKVDVAVVTGASQRCAYCKKFGATIPCKVPGCPKFYHFPCAMYDGAPMDLKSVAMVCPSHADRSRDILMDMACIICEHSSPESSLIFCSNCGNHYHGMCLKPPLTAVPAVRTGWQCPHCKMCQFGVIAKFNDVTACTSQTLEDTGLVTDPRAKRRRVNSSSSSSQDHHIPFSNKVKKAVAGDYPKLTPRLPLIYSLRTSNMTIIKQLNQSYIIFSRYHMPMSQVFYYQMCCTDTKSHLGKLSF